MENIKTKDFRVSNLLNHEQYGIVRVEGIHWNHRSIFCGRNQISDAKNWQEIDRFKPIPLTEEILLNCGFEKTKILGSYLKNTPHTAKGYGITIHSQYPFDNKLFTNVIEAYQIDGTSLFIQGGLKYLHQLQNLYFAITNEELEITL